MNDKLLDQADALMRRRSFIAGARPAEMEVPETSATAARSDEHHEIDELDNLDLPVLTDVVDPAADTQLASSLLSQQEAFHKALEAWLEEALPKAVAGALDGIGDYLVNELRDRARTELLSATRQPATGAKAASDDTLREELRNDPL